ncbi:MAG: PaaI family thioesterase [Parvularculaceae bacterium]
MTEAEVTATEISALFEREFPSWREGPLMVESAGFRYGVVQCAPTRGTCSRAAQYPARQCSCWRIPLYVAVLASVGPKLLSVTTSLTINFLRKPDVGDLIAECKLVKLGKRLAVGDVMIRPDGDEEAVAHAVGTYSIPA